MQRLLTPAGRRIVASAILALPLIWAVGTQAHDMAMMQTATAPAPVAADAVKIDNFSFEPAAIVVKPGTTVTWTNADDIPHTVTEADRKFKSPPLDTDDKWSHTFTEAGEYHYFCSLHSKMVGTVIVKP